MEEWSTLVYNFEVAQDDNYFVGDEGAEAHNTDLSDLANRIKHRLGPGTAAKLVQPSKYFHEETVVDCAQPDKAKVFYELALRHGPDNYQFLKRKCI